VSEREEIERLVEDEGLPYSIAQQRVRERTDASRIREFFEELDARIAGERGTHSAESRASMAGSRPALVRRAHNDPRAFVRDLERQLAAFRKEDETDVPT
jgi:hypothetical protein